MKKFKKLAASMLALVMALGMVAPAMAAEGDPYAGNDPKKASLSTASTGHQFTVYQLFKAAPADGSSLKENTIEWGDSVIPGTLIEALKRDFPEAFASITAESSAQDVAKVLHDKFETPGSQFSSVANNAALAKTIATSGAFNTSVLVTDKNTQDVLTGYCVMVDQPTTGEPIYMLRTVTGDVKIAPKDSTSQVTKEVWDQDKKNAEGEVVGGWSDGAIYKVGDDVDFKLTVALPDDIKSGKWTNATETSGYNIVLHDVQSEGLTFKPESVEIKVIAAGKQDQVLTSPDLYTLVETPADSCTFEIKIPNAQELENAAPGALIEITYQSQVNEDAVTGTDGNSNKVDMNVNTDVIPGEEVKVFELELDVNKVDGDGKPLTGAQFALYNPDDIGEDGKPIEGSNPVYVLTPSTEEFTDGDGVIWPAGSRFSVKGLKAGTYMLVETVKPDKKYNDIAPIEVKITADKTETTGPEGGKLTITVNQESKLTVDDDGVINGTIVNNQGLQLPETGGIGTTIFYILGGALAVGAVVLLITKRRVGSSDDE